jgi:hypothetical protein
VTGAKLVKTETRGIYRRHAKDMLRRENMNEATRDGVTVVVPDVSADEVLEAPGRAREPAVCT